jgi:hypothetical protein
MLTIFSFYFCLQLFRLIGKDRAYVTRDIKSPDPIPEEGQQLALEIMKTGRLYRYNVQKAEESIVSQCEMATLDTNTALLLFIVDLL